MIDRGGWENYAFAFDAALVGCSIPGNRAPKGEVALNSPTPGRRSS